MIEKRHRYGRTGIWMATAGLAWRVALASCLLTGVCAAAPLLDERGSGAAVLNVSFDRSLFHRLNENDAVAALKIWTKHFIETQGVDLGVQISSYESREELDSLLTSGEGDLMIMNTLGYLETEQSLRDTVTPLFVTALEDGSPYERYYLLTHIDSEITSCEDLIGKDVLILHANRSHLTEDWFRVELQKRGIAPEAINTQVVGELSKALLPVFFKQSDACVVNDSGYELMQELNPQLGRLLKPIITSPEFTETVICMRKDYQFEREEVIKGLGELHLEASGRQVMLVFKIDRLIPYQPDYLNSVSELIKGLEKIPKSMDL